MGDRDRDIFDSNPERTSGTYEAQVAAQSPGASVIDDTVPGGVETDVLGGGFDSLLQAIIAAQNPQGDDAPQAPEKQMITGENPWDTAYINPPEGVEPEPEYWEPPYADYRTERTRVAPKYTVNDPMRILNGMSSAQLVALEQQFVNAGYLDEDRITGGDRGSLIESFTTVVTRADANRVKWDEQLEGDILFYEQWKLDNPEEEEKTWAQNNPFVAPVYLAPDYATLAQAAKETVRGELGREVTSGEMKLLTGFLGEASKDAWKANEYNADLANWEARARAQETGENQSAGTVQGVDPAARFEEMFEDRFEGELAHRDRVDTVQQKQGNLFGSIDTISRMTS